MSPKVRLDRRRRGGIGRRRGSIGSSSSRCYDVLPLLLLRQHEVCGGFVSCRQFLTEKTDVGALSVSDVGSTCNVGEKLATYAHVSYMSAT